MTYIIIETFNPEKLKKTYQGLEEKGHRQPKELTNINSWIDEKMEKYYPFMEVNSIDKIHQ